MKINPMPPIERLRELFELDHKRGVLIRKRGWTNHKAGEVCGTPMKSGHWMTAADGKRYLVHRIVYFMATGIDPVGRLVDHVNGDPADNRPANLRLASFSENSRHKVKLSAVNRSGHRNVCWSNTWNCWLVSVPVNGKRVQRRFQAIDDAARCAAELRAQHFGDFRGLTL